MSQPRYFDEKTPLDINSNASTSFVPPPNPPSLLHSKAKQRTWKRRLFRSLLLVVLVMWMCLSGGEKWDCKKDSEKGMNEFTLPDSIPGRLLVPLTWGPIEPYNHSASSFTSGCKNQSLVSSLAEPLTISSSSSATHHFLKIIGKQSIGDITFVPAEKNETDLVVSVRAIWREEDEEWGGEELQRVGGGLIEDEESESLGVGILTEPPHPQSEARHPHQRAEEKKEPSLHFKIVAFVPPKLDGEQKSFEVLGGVFPVKFEDLGKKAKFGDLKVWVGIGDVDAENLLASTTNLTNSFGSILGNFSISSNLTLSSLVGPISANVSLLPTSPSSFPSTYNLTLLSKIGQVDANILSIPPQSTLYASALTKVGNANLTLPATGFEGDFLVESHVGKVNLEVVPVEGKVVTVREVKGRWWGGKATGEVEWVGKAEEERKKAKGEVVVRSEIGSVALRL